MELKIEAEAVKELVKQAIFDQLGEDARAKLVQGALDYLLTEPPQERYSTYKQPSPLQQAFNNAVGIAANEIVREQVAANPEFRDKVMRLVGEAFARFDEENYSNILGDAFAQAFKRS